MYCPHLSHTCMTHSLSHTCVPHSTQLQQTQCELDSTKVQAHCLLLDQATEITSSLQCSARLADRLQALHTQLQAQEEVWGCAGADTRQVSHCRCNVNLSCVCVCV